MSSNYQYAPSRIGPLVTKIQTGRLDLEMGYPSILWVILLATGYVIISGSTMTKFKECEEAKKSGHYKSLESLLSHTMAIAITIPVAFLLGQYFNKDATLWTLFYGVMGLIGSAVALDIARKCKKEGEDAEASQTIAAIGVAVYGCAMLIAGFLLFRTRKAKWN
ncbi:MAG: hypothetical protein CL494_05760 [Actinobacteria bacterium]|nr:hypothetical protein [Actinomycetota bacterium]|tara:strand:+ start:2705 stop:3196 length:492 start_codon:yes stop_codon:yes gene_type:complete